VDDDWETRSIGRRDVGVLDLERRMAEAVALGE